MEKILPAIIILLLAFLNSCTVSNEGIIEEPKYANNIFYTKHFAYSSMYNENYEQEDWVAYELLESELELNYKRTNKFLEDTLVATGTANNLDYKHSGYDRGHLAPAADMTWNEQAIMESFYFSNISPQLPSFNRGIWKKLEGQIRNWAVKYDCLYIATGPICINSEKTIGENKVFIPTHFYKTVLVLNDTLKQSIGFIFPHEKCNGDIFDYAVTVDSVDSVEIITGEDFYFALPNRYEESIEKEYDLKYWR